ncbi:hypothetical protein [Pseudoalteromonas sp. R3]|uniref:ATP-grasp domain-containing protein n=1 Tax=Pseudoalteromonas sp. R3 TaxID=1709477 RepID=UPI0006B48EB2|nr:hypothetical protein [Pseudoalteromonas sp. R3]AZZ97414.1 hypothetical protein ELR70_09955 [Pseudoalteromonas sp. R3]
MNILALQHKNFLGECSFKLSQWAKETFENCHLLLMTSCPAELVDETTTDEVCYAQTAPFVLEEVLSFINNRHIDLVLFHVEADTILSAQLRAQFGIAGQSLTSANAFRDKYVMKSLCAAQHIDVPGFTKVSPVNLTAQLSTQNDFPMVIKPLDSSGSRDTFILEDESSVGDYPQLEKYQSLMLEQFVSYDVYHVDGIVSQGEVVFSCVHKYISPNLSFLDGQTHGSILLSQHSDDAGILKTFAKRVIEAMPDTENYVFHCEIFYQPGNNPLLCEIASRPAGALIPQSIARAFNIDINHIFIQLQMGKTFHRNDFSPTPAEYTAYLLFPPLTGTLIVKNYAVPQDLGIIEYHANFIHGQHYNGGSNSVSHLFCCLLAANTPAQLDACIQNVNTWYKNTFSFEPRH